MTDYGHDLACRRDLNPSGAEVSGGIVVAELLVRMLQTPAGTLIGDPTRGFDLVGELDDDADSADVARIVAMIDAEFTKDQRVSSSSTSATLSAGVLITTSKVTLIDGQTFSLVLSVADIITVLKAA